MDEKPDTKGDAMNDLREYSFGDWFRLALKAAPAFLLASFLVMLPIIVILTLAWLSLDISR